MLQLRIKSIDSARKKIISKNSVLFDKYSEEWCLLINIFHLKLINKFEFGKNFGEKTDINDSKKH